jgi:hypothetical protein
VDWLASYKDATYFYKTWFSIGRRDKGELLRWASRNGYQKILEQILISATPEVIERAFVASIQESQLDCIIEFIKGNCEIT